MCLHPLLFSVYRYAVSLSSYKNDQLVQYLIPSSDNAESTSLLHFYLQETASFQERYHLETHSFVFVTFLY